MRELIDRLAETHTLSAGELTQLLTGRTPALSEYLFTKARQVREEIYGRDVYIRGLIEFTNYCKNDCYYCGIRRSNPNASRYRLDQETILACCAQGYELGFRTFVLQGGEDGYFTDERMVTLIRAIKAQHPDCALTLSMGERERESYQAFFDAGADRYLLRHETANFAHYGVLHPPELSPAHRQQCLWTLREIGYQVGAGFMVGSPGQEMGHLVEDLLFLQKLQPHMVGIGPFLPHKDTPFREEPPGDVELTLFLLGILRLMLPKVLLPATTALGTAAGDGRERGILAGANVVMPNLSPTDVRGKYLLYDNKRAFGGESAEGLQELRARMGAIGYQVVTSRGDAPTAKKRNIIANQ